MHGRARYTISIPCYRTFHPHQTSNYRSFFLSFVLALASDRNRNGLRPRLGLGPTFPLRVLRIVLVEVVLVLARRRAPGAVPEVVRLRVHAVRGGDDLDEVPARDLDRGDLGRGQPDEVREDAADDGGVSDDEQVFALALELDERRFETDCWCVSGFD